MTRSATHAGLSFAWRALAWLVYGFLILPSIVVIPMSFGDKDEFVFPPQSFSFYLYRKYFLDSNWVETTLVSLQVAAGATCLSLVLGIGGAYALSRLDFPGKKLLTLFLISPMFVPAIVLGLGLYLYFGVAHITGTVAGLIAGHTVVTLPFVVVTALAGLRHIDRNLELAATVMRAGRQMVLRRITLPLLAPTILVAGLFSLLTSFDEVVISYFISSAQLHTLPVKMYSSIHWEISPVLAAISTLLTAASLLICLEVAALQKDA